MFEWNWVDWEKKLIFNILIEWEGGLIAVQINMAPRKE